MNRTEESTVQLKGYGRNKWNRSGNTEDKAPDRFYTSCSKTRTRQVYHASAQFLAADLYLAVHDHAYVNARGHASVRLLLYQQR